MKKIYKVWIEIEEITRDENEEEKFQDAGEPMVAGEFDTYEEAEKLQKAISLY